MDLQSDSFVRRRKVFKTIWNKGEDRSSKQGPFTKNKVIKTMKQSSGSMGNKKNKIEKYEEKYKKLSQACNKILQNERKTGNNQFIERILGPQSSPKRKRRKRKSRKRDVHEELYRNGNLNLREQPETREKPEPEKPSNNGYKITVKDIDKESLTDLPNLEYYLQLQSQNAKPHPSSALSRSSFFKRKVIPPGCVAEYTGFKSPTKKPNNRNIPNNAITLAMTRSIRTLRHPTKKELQYTYYTIKFPEV